MNFAVTTSFASIAERTQHKTIACDDPYHKHPSPFHEMFGAEYRGHWVAVTICGSEYSVRIDRNPLTDRHGMTRGEAFAYVERMTR